ncbi:MAG: hypothetical protein OHK0038_13320 [Flammeovirgaceae bacterium]
MKLKNNVIDKTNATPCIKIDSLSVQLLNFLGKKLNIKKLNKGSKTINKEIFIINLSPLTY